MGQNIEYITIGSIEQEALKKLISNADKHLLKKRFKLGDGHCRFEQINSEIVTTIINDNRCEVIELIEKSIESTDEDCLEQEECCDYITKPCQETLYCLWLNRGNKGSLQDYLITSEPPCK